MTRADLERKFPKTKKKKKVTRGRAGWYVRFLYRRSWVIMESQAASASQGTHHDDADADEGG